MANSLGTNPITLDTASAGTVLRTSKLKIQRVIWEATTTGDVVTINDKNGNLIWTWTAQATPDMVESNIGDNWYNGLIAEVIDSGVVKLYLSTQ